MRKCKGYANVYENGTCNKIEFELGYFHQFGVSYEEFETGAGNYTTAVIELPNGRIVTPPVENITFLDTEDYVTKEVDFSRVDVKKLMEELKKHAQDITFTVPI